MAIREPDYQTSSWYSDNRQRVELTVKRSGRILVTKSYHQDQMDRWVTRDEKEYPPEEKDEVWVLLERWLKEIDGTA